MMKTRLAAFVLVGALGCGGGGKPPTGMPDLTATLADADLAMSTAGDMAGACTPPTTGFYVAIGQGDHLVRISPDPASWDGGPSIAIVDTAGHAVGGFMTAVGGQLYFNAAGHLYSGLANGITNNQLVVTDLGKILPITGDPAYGVIAPNANFASLIIEYSVISAYFGALNTNPTMVTSSDHPFNSSCALVDFEGTVHSDGSYDLDVLCGTDIVHNVNGMDMETIASGTTHLAGVQVYNGVRYIIDNAGNLLDGNLSLIKKTRLCTDKGSPNYGHTIIPVSM